MSVAEDSQAELAMDYDRSKEIKAFDDTKASVKGLVDAGIVELPRMFIRPTDELAEEFIQVKSTLQVPVIDLSDLEVEDARKKIVDEIREASEKWRFFQLINHGIPSNVLEGMIDGTHKFHEQDAELKKEYYSLDRATRRVRYQSSIQLYQSKTAKWRDSLNISRIDSGQIEPEEIPPVCRCSLKITTVDHLKATECDKGQVLACHYYPACPQPELTLGTAKHTDPSFLTIVLQDQSGRLQVMRDNQLADVTPIQHGLIVNIGDLVQILSNDKFVSANHRVEAKKDRTKDFSGMLLQWSFSTFKDVWSNQRTHI